MKGAELEALDREIEARLLKRTAEILGRQDIRSTQIKALARAVAEELAGIRWENAG